MTSSVYKKTMQTNSLLLLSLSLSLLLFWKLMNVLLIQLFMQQAKRFLANLSTKKAYKLQLLTLY